jgi:signal transduction histidine kinase
VQSKTYKSIDQRLAALKDSGDLSPASIELVAELQKLLEKERKRYEFIINRISTDKQIANNLLNTALADAQLNLRKLEISNEEMEHFMHVASHDLKTPLRSIGSFSNLVNRRYGKDLPEIAQEYLNYIQSSSKAMNVIIEDLVNFNAAGSYQKVESFDFDELAKEIETFLFADIEESGAQLTFEPFGMVSAPRSAVGQLLQNLIRNAIVYRELTRPCEIKVTLQRGKEGFTFCVADNGVGLSSDYREKAFLPFKRVGDLTREGSGMGLAICRRIARKTGGDIDFRGEVGVGTSFYVGIGEKPMIPTEVEA